MNPNDSIERINSGRRAQGAPELNSDEFLGGIENARSSIENDQLSVDEKRALAEFRMREHEDAIKNTPLFIKVIWALILGAVFYFIFR
jgi:hypothetical protein